MRPVLALVALTTLLGSIYTAHVIDKRLAVSNARDGWVQELELNVAKSRIIRMVSQLQTERAANTTLVSAQRSSEQELKALEKELLNDLQAIEQPLCVITDYIFERLR